MAKFKTDYLNEQKEKLLNKFRELTKELPDFMTPYLQSLELGAKPTTAVQYARDLISFMQFLQSAKPACKNMATSDIPKEVIEKLTYLDINAFETYLQSGSYHINSPETINRTINTLRSYFSYEVSHDNLVKNPTKGAIKMKEDETKDIHFLTSMEVRALLSSIDEMAEGDSRQSAFSRNTRLRDIAIITLLLNTGIRISECVGLDLDHIDFEEQSFEILRKGGKKATLYFNNDVKTTLMDYINNERLKYAEENERALFLSNRKKRIAVRSIQKMLQRYGELSNIEKLHPHVLRKTFGTNLYGATGDVELVATMLGHSNMNTTKEHYSAITQEHMAQNKNFYLYEKKD